MAEMQEDQVRNQMQERVVEGQMSQADADRAVEMSSRFQEGAIGTVFMGIGTVVAIFVSSLIAAALLLLIGNVIHNGSEKFAKYWSLIWYAGVLSSANLLIMGILIRVTQDPNGGHLGLAILTKGNPLEPLHQVASLVNIFSVWEVFVVGIGLSIFAKISRGLGIVWAFIVILVLPALIIFGIGSISGTFGG
ncbi:Yip1 domain protein [bacterium BMS3Bbin04]|nr:Yip1 domain protein [bacterium BMS3Bbin04]